MSISGKFAATTIIQAFLPETRANIRPTKECVTLSIGR